MPKLPKGMFRRTPGGSWYLRLCHSGRDRWASLGSDFTKAVRRALEVHSGASSTLGGRVTVGQAAKRWLETFVRTRHNEKGRKLTEGRVRQYLEPYMGHHQVDRVTGEDFRAYRLWLERTTTLSATSVWHCSRTVAAFSTGPRKRGSWRRVRFRVG